MFCCLLFPRYFHVYFKCIFTYVQTYKLLLSTVRDFGNFRVFERQFSKAGYKRADLKHVS